VNVVEILDQREVLKYRRTGDDFEVRKVTGEFVILHSRHGLLQVLTGIKSVFHLFEKVPDGSPPKDGSKELA